MYSLRSRRVKDLPSLFEEQTKLPSRKRRQDKTTKISSPSKREDRVLVEKTNDIPISEQLSQSKLDFPIRKRRQETTVTSKITSPSKKDKTEYKSHNDVRRCLSKIQPPVFDIQSCTTNKLEKVKSALHSNPPDCITCREKEIDRLQSFLLTHINDDRPGSLFVSGPPGTGKTATLMLLLDQHKKLLEDTDVVIINCMSLTTPQSIYTKIATELGIKSEKKLREHIISTQSMILLVLDEIDQCSQQVLYTLFEWPGLTGSHVILIGIANSLDLTDRVLPRLKARPQTTPELLMFPPYSKDDILSILQSRLEMIPDSSSVIDSTALQFCARKVSAVHGDIRQALDICRSAVELVQTRTSKTGKSVIEPVKVSISHISSVLEDVFGNGATRKTVTDSMPLQQKLVICSIIVATRTKSNRDILLGKLYNIYEQVCQKQKLRHESQRDFVSLLDMLEAQGIVTVKKAKETSLHKVSLLHQESELTHVLSDQTLLSSVLQKDLP